MRYIKGEGRIYTFFCLFTWFSRPTRTINQPTYEQKKQHYIHVHILKILFHLWSCYLRKYESKSKASIPVTYISVHAYCNFIKSKKRNTIGEC